MSLTYDVNNKIKAAQVRLIGKDNEQLGVFTIRDALDRANEDGLDLVQVNPSIVPPLCRIVDFGKFKYDLSIAEKDRKKKNRENQVEIKEVQLRPVTDDHDISIKAKRAVGFLEDNDKVKVLVKFRGREVAHREMGEKVIESFCSAVGLANYKVESPLAVNGRQMSIILGPNKK